MLTTYQGDDDIRKAIAAQLGVACPLCRGKGVVPRGIHDHFAPLLNQLNSHNCDSCGSKLSLPLESTEFLGNFDDGNKPKTIAKRDQKRRRLRQELCSGSI